MSRNSVGFAAAAVLLVAACNDPGIGAANMFELSSAFSSIPAGFDGVQSSFSGAAHADSVGGPGMPWMPPHGGAGRGRGGPGGGGPGMGDFMGGGLGADFIGGIGVGHGIGRGPFGGDTANSTCTFSASTGDVTCAAETRNGITSTRIATYKTTAGVAQAKPDSTTNSARVRMTVSGARTRRDSAIATLQSSSDRTVTGLAQGSTLRTVNGTARGTENTTGTNTSGSFTSLRVTGDTATGITVPVVDGRPTYPTAGTVIRVMKVTAIVAGGTPTVSERREVVTYNGTAAATVVITQDGTTKTCSLPLPHGRPSCQ